MKKIMRCIFISFIIWTTIFGQESKNLALTFDDGPKVKITEEILEVLRENDVKATFFIVGQNGKWHPEILKKIHDDGHQIANHSYTHTDFKKITMEEIKKELEKTNKVITKTTGEKVVYFRAPYGSITKEIRTEIKNSMEMTSVMWNICPEDWKKTVTANNITTFLLENSKNNGIVLLHDYVKTAEALKTAIPQLKEQGFEFVTIEEMYKKK